MSERELGKRAVACKGWRWMPGMLAYVRLTLDGKPYERRVQVVSGEGRSFLGTTTKPGKSTDNTRSWGMVRHVQAAPVEEEDFIPDLTDPATLGCLLALVREAWPHEWHEFMVPIFDGISHWYVGCLMPGTSRIVMPTRVMQTGLLDALPPKPTEAEALVAALEAAP